ncbi:hypothetical protein K6119_05960 [Paracrocinitomix mangrovi]|uniref:WD40/YVTN/BNR-like repeat-containing protein n=1 Tax=Paracrocinitomix mangrovi TaxID=2862509 RepID=UPI001C8D5029|nr:hypothetical protein [Paracrocinitomix mangrovi]UKN03055.1 hypothetical protein K6119_05960 [Paracrocinitomix mangrovi]
MLKSFPFVFIFWINCSIAQDYNFQNPWQNLGPEQKPLEDRKQTATGIGPVEFIRVHPKKEGLLMAGSLNGGLFYSNDGGEQWYNAGTDEWKYSGSSWAEFHPQNENIWIAGSCYNNANGQPGNIGHYGGIYRTMNGGVSWELVADKSKFINSEYLTIYGFKFNPEKVDQLFVYTSEGFFTTKDITQAEPVWERVTDLGGWIYDLQFQGDFMYVTQMQFGKWNLIQMPLNNPMNYKRIGFVSNISDIITSMTIRPVEDDLLVLVNYDRKSDELILYDIQNDKDSLLMKNQRVVFGTGRTFEVSPHNQNEVMIGVSTTVKMWNLKEKSEIRIKGGYHVDIEGVAYDPFDSLKIYIATHGGVYTTPDHGETWLSTSKGLGIAEVEGLAVSQMNTEQMVIGCFHDGSMLRSDFNKDGIYEWKTINGGDGLLPLQPKDNPSIVYSSNQYLGGGLFVSIDSGKTSTNMHSLKRIKTSGWQMSAVIHPVEQNLVFFNYLNQVEPGKGNIELCRTDKPTASGDVDRLTDFETTHDIKSYSILGVYNSETYVDKLVIYVVENFKDANGDIINIHRVFINDDVTLDAEVVKNNWVELDIPRSDWLADIQIDPNKENVLYLSYASGKYGAEFSDEDNGMIYALKYNKKIEKLRRAKDISLNIPYGLTGRKNIAFDQKGGMFFGTRNGIFYGDAKTLKGRNDWQKIGFGTPHCKVNGIYFDPKKNSLTIGYYGRGVWRYYF